MLASPAEAGPQRRKGWVMESDRTKSRGHVIFTLVSSVVVALAGTILAGAIPRCTENFAVAADPANAAPDSTVTLRATGLHDAFCNPIPGATVVFDVTLPDGSVQPAGQDETDDAGAAEVLWAGTSLYGTYTTEATAGAATTTTDFGVAPGDASGLFAVVPDPLTAVAGTAVVLTASGIVDAAGKPVINGTRVTFSIARPDGATGTCIAETNGVTDSSDDARAVCAISEDDNTRAGSYQVSASAAAATGSTTYRVIPGAPVADLNIAASDVILSGPGSVDVCRIPAEATQITLAVTKPNGDVFLAGTSDPFTDGCASVDLAGAQIDQAGAYDVEAKAKDQQQATVGIGWGSFDASPLEVSADDVFVWQGNVAEICGLPSEATEVLLTMTKPDGSTSPPLDSFVIEEGCASISIPGGQIDQEGSFDLAVDARDDGGDRLGAGQGSFVANLGPHEWFYCRTPADIGPHTDLDQAELTPSPDESPDPEAWHPSMCIATGEDDPLPGPGPLLFWSGHPLSPALPSKPCGELWVAGTQMYDSDTTSGNSSLC